MAGQGTDFNKVYGSRVTEDTRVTSAMGDVFQGDFGYTEKVGGTAGRGTMPANAYMHEDSNVVTSDDLKLNLQFQPNILDGYDVATYHWKLFIVSTQVTSSGNVLNLRDQIIIAESGVSDLTIDKVDLRFLTTPSVESGTGILTNVKFEIVEPAGAGLIDKLFYQSVALGIGNWHVMPIYLQLEFRGRSAETSESTDVIPGALGNLKWLWVLKMGDIKANVTTVGTKYDFTAILYDQVTQSNAVASLKYNATLNNLTTFESAMNELADKFNADQLLTLISTSSIPDVFKIIVDPKIAGYNITPPNNNTNSIRSNDYVKFDKKSATFNVGTSIDKIVDALLSNTNEYQMSMVGSTTPGAEGVPMQSEVSQMKKFWRIITEARPLAFDKRRQNTSTEFTIYIVEYDVGILDANTSQTSNPPYTTAASKKRLATYVKKAILKKKYNYMFTGLNDQIISFDLNLNCAFGAAASRLSGVYSNSAMVDKGVTTQDNSVEEAAITEKLTKAISFQNNASSSNSAGASAALIDARDSIKNSKLPEDTKSRYIKLLENSKPENRLIYLEKVRASGGIDNDGEFARVRSVSTNIAKPVSDFAGSFISDVDVNSSSAKDTYAAFLNSTKGKLRPIAYYETVQDKAVGLGIESNSNSGIQKLSSMFSVALHSGLDASLQKIKMTIKGDPFWLFPQPITGNTHQLYNSLKPKNVAIDHIKRGHFNITDSVNIYGSDNFIIIRFRTPRIFNTDANTEDGSNAYNEVETFSGVYKVVSIHSRFDMGKFVQDLECILDPEIRLLDFMKEIEDDAKKPDIITTPSDLATIRDVIPPTAIKEQRIMGEAAGNKVQMAQSAITSNVPVLKGSILHGLAPSAPRA